MQDSEVSAAIKAAGGEGWNRRVVTVGERFRILAAVAVSLPVLAHMLEPLWPKLWEKSLKDLPTAIFVSLVGPPLLVFVCFAVYMVLWEVLAISLERLVKRGRALEATLYDASQPAARGVITSAPEPALPVMLREPVTRRNRPKLHGADSEVKMTAQSFAIEGHGGALLVDTPYIELVGARPSAYGRATVWDALTVSVGAEVLVHATETEDAPTPPWFTGASASPGYRERKIRRLVGTEKRPIRLLVLSPP